MKWIPRPDRTFFQILLIGLLMLAPAAAQAQTSEPGAPETTGAHQPAVVDGDGETAQRFFEAVTVSSTLNESTVKETPGTVSVVDAAAIDRGLVADVSDLIRFTPGVYVESHLTGVGLNGFNIRGIGGNRVMTQVDGVETAEQFDFGPFNMHQFALDPDTLKSAEIVRSAGSSLYGSDALGGVVSLFTRDPADYLGGRPFHVAAKTLFDGRSRTTSGNVVVAGGSDRVQASLFLSYGSGHELANQGDVEAADSSRTAPNPLDRRTVQALGKLVVAFSPGNTLRATIETADNLIESDVYSAAGEVRAGPTVTDVRDVVAEDTLERQRFSLDHAVDNVGGLNTLSWSVFVQASDASQTIDEVRTSLGFGPPVTAARHGTMDFEQRSWGATVQGRKAVVPGGHAILLTFGASHKVDDFDMIRDRVDINVASGVEIPSTTLPLPSKYFPTSHVTETGVHLQAEMRVGSVLLIPGVRVDRFSLDADETDPVYLASGNPAGADFSANAVSARLGASVDVTSRVTVHGQYAGGFRAPPYSAVNTGFSNLLHGYRSIPNTDLEPETSDTFDFGIRAGGPRASVGVTGFVNLYDNFIDLADLGFNPASGLLEYQHRNVAEVRIRGVELEGEVDLTETLRFRASYAIIRGDDVSGDEDVRLTSVAPDRGTFGLEYTDRSTRWGADLTVRTSAGVSQEDVGEDLFAAPAYGVADVTAWIALADDVQLRGGLLNLTDATYYEWANVRGREAGSDTIVRYSNPGVSGILSLAYGW